MSAWRRRLVTWPLGLALLLLLSWIGYTFFFEGNLGQPEYRVVEEIGEVEIRRYTPFIIASTAMQEGGDSGLRSGFRVLAGYIFGGNEPAIKLAMTAPVLQQNESGESLPMQAPVLANGEDKRMAFVMPEGRTLDDLPKPDDPKVSLNQVDWGMVAAIRFSGRGKQKRFHEAEKSLREILSQTQHTASGPALFAQYNSPSAFPPMRRNEVLIPIQ